jgi:hypothetical protein
MSGTEALDLLDVGGRVRCFDPFEERAGLVPLLVADDGVVAAPVEPERKRETREPTGVVERAALVPVGARSGAERSSCAAAASS